MLTPFLGENTEGAVLMLNFCSILVRFTVFKRILQYKNCKKHFYTFFAVNILNSATFAFL